MNYSYGPVLIYTFLLYLDKHFGYVASTFTFLPLTLAIPA